MINLSKLSNDETARANYELALQRAENIYILGGKRVLELCVGPSLSTLEEAYNAYGIMVIGNDIDGRWRDYYPQGNWYIGTCYGAIYNVVKDVDTVVFAPPVTVGCTGKREDSLMINQVEPTYNGFMRIAKEILRNHLKVMVLPARSISTPQDRQQYHKLLSTLDSYEECHLTEGRRKIRKYIDIYYK